MLLATIAHQGIASGSMELRTARPELRRSKPMPSDTAKRLAEKIAQAVIADGWSEPSIPYEDDVKDVAGKVLPLLEPLVSAAQKVLSRYDAGDIGIEYKWEASEIRAEIEALRKALESL
jgi:hypothetical protein